MGTLSDFHQDVESVALRLVADYREALRAEAVSLCNGDQAAAEDLVFRTLEVLFRDGAPTGPDRGATMLAWLRGVMRRIHHDGTRGKARAAVVYLDPETLSLVSDARAADAEDMAAETPPAPDAIAAAGEDAEAVREAIASLSPSMREVIVLHYFENIPVARIASVLRVSQDAVKCRLYYARKVLARRLRKHVHGPAGKVVLLALALAVFAAIGAAIGSAVLAPRSTSPVPSRDTPSGESEKAPIILSQGESTMNPTAKTTALLASASLALATGVQADSARRIVRDGETLTWPHAYTYYRFVIKDRSDTARLRIAELALYDADGNRINLGLSTAADVDKATTNLLAGTYALYANQVGDVWESFDKMFDDNSSTSCNCWINTANSEWHWWYFTMRLADNADPVASYNIALASEYEKGPKSWVLQGSDDHTTWITLDEKPATEVAAIAPPGAGWYNGGEGIAVNDASAHFFVERGGTLAVAAPTEVKSVHSYGGHIVISSGATLGVDVNAGESARSIGGGFSGTGSFEKTGSGTLAMSGVNSDLAGTVKAAGGTLAFRPLHLTPKFTYYRFIVKERDTSNQRLRIAEIALYDADGNRINKGLTQVTHGSGLSEGTCDYSGSFDPYGSLNQMFDDNIGTDREGWSNSGNNSWAYFTMRLADDADVAPAFYNIGFGSTANVRSWALQGSNDGTTWLTLDEKSSTEVSAIAPSSLPGWCNGGTPLPLVFEGYNAPVGEVDAAFFRFSVKAFGTTGSGGTRALAELALYDAQGQRLNLGLSNMGRNYSGTLPAGSFTFSHSAGTYNADSTHEEKMFDEDLATRLSGWSYPTTPNPANESSWIRYTMRLADNVAPVASYNFAAYENNDNTMPINWIVEASRDGSTCFEVEARSGEAATSLLPHAARTYCNNGHPIGFTTGCDRWLAPTSAVVQVSNGAALELPAAGLNTVAGLAFDLPETGVAGSIANFNPAPDGMLRLASAKQRPALEDYPLPITFTGLTNAANVASWSVAVNGTVNEEDKWVLRFDEDDVLRVTRKLAGTFISIR